MTEPEPIESSHAHLTLTPSHPHPQDSSLVSFSSLLKKALKAFYRAYLLDFLGMVGFLCVS